MRYREQLCRLGSIKTVKSCCLMSVVMMEIDGSSIKWDSGCASVTSFYELTRRNLELLSERYSNIDSGHNAKGRATAVNPLLLFVTFNKSHNITYQVSTSQDRNSETREPKWQNNRLVRLPLFGCLCHY